MDLRSIFFVIFIALANLSANAQNVMLDKKFNSTGFITGNSIKQLTNFKNLQFTDCVGACELPDKNIIIVVNSIVSYKETFSIIKLFPDGKVDNTFAENGIFTHKSSATTNARSIAVKKNGSILVAGNVENANTESDFILLQLNAAGKLVSDFANGGIFIHDFFSKIDVCTKMILLDDESILLSGNSTAGSKGGVSTDFTIIKILPNGKIDMNFGVNGIVLTEIQQLNEASFDNCYTAFTDSKNIYLAGVSQVFGQTGYATIVKYNLNGKIDQSFANNGIFLEDFGKNKSVINVQSLKILNSGKIIACGNIDNIDCILFAINSNGIIDNSFANDGVYFSNTPHIDYFNDVIEMENGSIISVGSSYLNNEYDIMIGKFDNSGKIENKANPFQVISFQVDDFANSILKLSDDRYLIIGMCGNNKSQSFLVAKVYVN